MVEKNVASPGMTKEQLVNELEVAHPIGKDSNQIIVKFCRRPVRNSVVLKAKKMLDNQKDRYRIVEDMIKGDYDKKRRAFPLMDKEFKDGKKVRFMKRRLFINGAEVKIPE